MEKDILKQAAECYKSLLTKEYRVILGRKNKAIELKIQFLSDQFYHLAGLHKLKMQYSFKTKAHSSVLKEIVKGHITCEYIKDDENYIEVKQRLDALTKLENILDSNSTQYYEYNIKKVRFPSRLTAEYLIEGTLNGEKYIFTFLIMKNKICACKSIFYKEKYDYTLGQTKYTLLLLEKTNCKTNNIELFFKHKNYDEGVKTGKEDSELVQQ